MQDRIACQGLRGEACRQALWRCISCVEQGTRAVIHVLSRRGGPRASSGVEVRQDSVIIFYRHGMEVIFIHFFICLNSAEFETSSAPCKGVDFGVAYALTRELPRNLISSGSFVQPALLTLRDRPGDHSRSDFCKDLSYVCHESVSHSTFSTRPTHPFSALAPISPPTSHPPPFPCPPTSPQHYA